MSRNGASASARVNALTIDVEEYFHPNAMDGVVAPGEWDHLPARVEGATHVVLDLLDAHEVRATFFVLGWVAERLPGLVDEIARRGHEIGSHGYAHRLVYKLGPRRFREDVLRGKAVLEDRLGAPVAGFRAASFSVVPSTPWAIDALIEAGFRYDSSIFPIRHDMYGYPGFSRFAVRLRTSAGEIVEVPASTVRMLGRNWPVGGGGYFRLLPYWLTRRAVRRINTRDAAAALVYLHPWELDAAQPRLPAPMSARFRQYTNLHYTRARIERLLRDFRFAPIREALSFDGLPIHRLEAGGEALLR